MTPAPTDMVTPETANLIATIGIVSAAFLLTAYCANLLRTTGDPTGLLMCFGGLICSLGEPIVDILGQCYFPEKDAWIVFETFGRGMPVWLVAAYVLYFGALSFLISRFMKTGPTRGQMWAGLGGLFVINLMLEIPNLASDLYVYYGEQPWEIAGFPVAWLVINCQGALFAATILARHGDFFTGARKWLILALPFATYFSSWIIAMPHFMMVNSGAPEALKWLGSAVTIAVAVWFIDFLIRYGIDGQGDRAQPAADAELARA